MTSRSDFRVDIDAAQKRSNLSQSDFRLVSPYQYESILIAILDRFTTLGKQGLDQTWWWNALKKPNYSIALEYPPAALKQLICPQETVWFVAEDWHRTKKHGNFWLYEGKVEAIVSLLSEMYGFEYYVVSKKYDWLLCETHHDCLIGVGESMVNKMQQLQQI